MLLVLHNFVLVHRRIQAGDLRGNIDFVEFLGAPLPTLHAIATIGLVDYYGRVFTANDLQWKENLTIPTENVLPIPAPPLYQVLAPPLLDRFCSNFGLRRGKQF